MVWIRASSWLGARLNLIRCPVTHTGACIETTRTCNWRGAWQRFAAFSTRSSPPARNFLTRFAHYAERSIYLTDACVDLDRSPDLYVSEKAREIAPVRMVGTYGSEMLLHAVMFKAVRPTAGLFQADLASHIIRAEETYNRSLQVHPMTFVAFRQSPWHHFGVLGLEQTQVAVRSPYLDNDFVKTIYKAPGTIAANEEARLRLIREGNPALAKLRTDRGIGGLNSVFTRGLLEFLFKAEYAYDYGMPQWVAQVDHLFAPLHLERIWLGRHKVFHFRVWYRDQLANYVREMLLDPRSLARPVRRTESGSNGSGRSYQRKSKLHDGNTQTSDPGTHPQTFRGFELIPNLP